MKFRKDFVTNSSSSSFIIATNDNVTEEEIENFIKINSKQISSVKKSNYLESSIKDIKENLKTYIRRNNKSCNMKLNNWNVSVQEVTNESDNDLDIIFYELEFKNTENIKFGGFC